MSQEWKTKYAEETRECYKLHMLLFALPAMGSRQFTGHHTFQARTEKQKGTCHFTVKLSKATDRKKETALKCSHSNIISNVNYIEKKEVVDHKLLQK